MRVGEVKEVLFRIEDCCSFEEHETVHLAAAASEGHSDYSHIRAAEAKEVREVHCLFLKAPSENMVADYWLVSVEEAGVEAEVGLLILEK